MIRKLFISTLLLLTVLGAAVSAQTVDEIVAKNIEATGGYEKWKAIKTMKIVHRSEFFSFNEYWKKPNLLRIEVAIPYPEDVDIRAFDGKTGWRINPAEGSKEPRSMSTAESEDLLNHGAYLNDFLDYKQEGHKFELLGQEDVDGTGCFKLKLTRKTGEVFTVYVDSKRFLRVKTILSTRDPQGAPVDIAVVYSEYKLVEGLLLPHRVGKAVREYEIDKPMHDDLFKFPKQEQAEESAKQESRQTVDVGDPKVRAQLLKDHPEADVNKDGKLDLEEAWAFTKQQDRLEQLLEVGQPAPYWELIDPKGEKHKLSDYRGKIVVMDFWAVWCIPCHKAMPSLQKLHDKYRQQGLVVLGVSTWEKGGDPAQLMKDRHYNYGLMLNGEKITKDYHIAGLPTIYVVGRDGRLIYSGFGANAIAEKRRDDLIEKEVNLPGKP